MIRVHTNIKQGTDEWLTMRKSLYTGSNAHKLLQHAQKRRVVNGTVESYALPVDDGFGGNFHTRRGHALEEQAIALYEQIKGVKVDRPGIVTNIEFPKCAYSPDGYRMFECTIEVKAFKEDKHLQLINGDIPIEVLAQCHFGMMICGVDRCDLTPINPRISDPKRAFKIIPIYRNEKIINNFKRVLNDAVYTN